MKKKASLVLPVLLLSACQTLDTTAPVKKAPKADSVVLDNLLDSLSGDVRIQAQITSNYSDTTYRLVDEVGETARNTMTAIGNGIGERHSYIRDEDGNTIEETLNIHNDVVSTALDDGQTEPTPIDFDSTYGSPFQALTEDNIDKFFTLEETEEGYRVLPSAYGEPILATSLDAFYPMHDSYTWDSYSLTSYADDIVITADENGIPETLSFDHVKTDAYGGIVEHVEATLEVLPSIPRLAPIASTLPASEREALQNAIDTLGDNIRSGNFTQRVLMTEAGDSGLPAIYRNYYDLPYTGDMEEGLGLMLSDFGGLNDGTGTVYTGLGYGWQSDESQQVTYGYWAVGVTPVSGQFGMVSNEFYPSIAQAIPTLSQLSADFFEKEEEGVYRFDLSAFEHYNREFAIEVLTAILGVGDYLSHISAQFYVDDSVALTFGFKTLTIDITKPENPTFELTYLDTAGTLQTTQTSFSDFGTTDLRTVDSLSDAVDIAILNIFGVQNENE